MEQLPTETKQQLKRLQGAIAGLEQVADLLASSRKDLDAEGDPLQRAQTYLALAQAVHALYRLQLLAQGVQLDSHPFGKETERLRLYKRKVKRAAAEKELSEARRSTTLNLAAANRFIGAAMTTDLSQEQRQELAQVVKRKPGTHSVPAPSAAKRSKPDDPALTFLNDVLGADG